MRRARLPFEDYLGTPTALRQYLTSDLDDNRSWEPVLLLVGTYAERIAVTPESGMVFIQTNYAANNPAGVWSYNLAKSAWIHSSAIYCVEDGKFYTPRVKFIGTTPSITFFPGV